MAARKGGDGYHGRPLQVGELKKLEDAELYQKHHEDMVQVICMRYNLEAASMQWTERVNVTGIKNTVNKYVKQTD